MPGWEIINIMPLRAISLKFTDSTLFWGSSASFSILTMKLASLNTKILKGSSCCCHPFSAHKWWGYKTGSQKIAISLCLKRLVHLFSVSKSVEEIRYAHPACLADFAPLHPSYKFKAQIEKPWKGWLKVFLFTVNNLLEYYVWKTLFCNSISALILELPEPNIQKRYAINTFTNNKSKNICNLVAEIWSL